MESVYCSRRSLSSRCLISNVYKIFLNWLENFLLIISYNFINLSIVLDTDDSRKCWKKPDIQSICWYAYFYLYFSLTKICRYLFRTLNINMCSYMLAMFLISKLILIHSEIYFHQSSIPSFIYSFHQFFWHLTYLNFILSQREIFKKIYSAM